MENKIYNDDVERIVNDPKKKRMADMRDKMAIVKKQKNIFEVAYILTLLAVLFLVCGLSEFIIYWLAYGLTSILALCSAFCWGRLYEHARIYGWYL